VGIKIAALGISASFTIAFGKGLPFGMMPAIPALVAMTDSTTDVVDKLEAAL
jgi:hypothetical protein